jgi:cell division protein FtsB
MHGDPTESFCGKWLKEWVMRSLVVRVIAMLLLAGNIWIAYQLFLGKNGISDLARQRARYEEMVALDHDLNEACRRMSTEIRLLGNDPQFLEKAIRRELNFLKKNEILYLLAR